MKQDPSILKAGPLVPERRELTDHWLDLWQDHKHEPVDNILHPHVKVGIQLRKNNRIKFSGKPAVRG